jgi:dTDP-4-amino-4,6-dideoxygalactose transaminase
MLDVGRGNQSIRNEVLSAFAKVYDSGRFLYGPQVAELEQSIAAKCNAKHAIGCASGSDALLLALMVLDIGPGDEVILPSFTFFATASAVSRLGARPVFADIDPRTFNLDPSDVAAKISSKTRAIIPVHLFGQSAAMPELVNIAGNREIPIIEDAAQAIGAAYHGRPIGSWGCMGCISFYPTKNLGGFGDGGMLVTSSDTLADRLRLLAGHGMRPRYHHLEIGINSRLDTLQAAGLLIKAARLERYTADRQARAARYIQLFSETNLARSGAITMPYQDPAAFHVWNQFSLRVHDGQRDALRAQMTHSSVGSEIYYPIPLHQQVCFRGLGYAAEDLPATFQAAKEILHLPLYPEITDQEQIAVVQSVRGFFESASNRAAA